MNHFQDHIPAAEESASELLERLQRQGAETELASALDRIGEKVAAGNERDAAAGMDPQVEALLDAIAGDERAPLEFRALHRRVEQGRLRWAEFWADPTREDGGSRLAGRVFAAQMTDARQVMSAFDERGSDSPRESQ